MLIIYSGSFLAYPPPWCCCSRQPVGARQIPPYHQYDKWHEKYWHWHCPQIPWCCHFIPPDLWMFHLPCMYKIPPLGTWQGLGRFHDIWAAPIAHPNYTHNPNGKDFCVYPWNWLRYRRSHNFLIAPQIYSVDNTIRHQEAGKFPRLQDSAGNKKKHLTLPLQLPVVLTTISGWV